VTLTFSVSQDSDGSLYAEPGDDLNVKYAACQGIGIVTGEAANNDLASYAKMLVRDGTMKVRAQRATFDTLVGFQSPGDIANERSCKAAGKPAAVCIPVPKLA
jgi:hypothetical protein